MSRWGFDTYPRGQLLCTFWKTVREPNYVKWDIRSLKYWLMILHRQTTLSLLVRRGRCGTSPPRLCYTWGSYWWWMSSSTISTSWRFPVTWSWSPSCLTGVWVSGLELTVILVCLMNNPVLFTNRIFKENYLFLLIVWHLCNHIVRLIYWNPFLFSYIWFYL